MPKMILNKAPVEDLGFYELKRDRIEAWKAKIVDWGY